MPSLCDLRAMKTLILVFHGFLMRKKMRAYFINDLGFLNNLKLKETEPLDFTLRE